MLKTRWQDLVLTVGNLLFLLALIPSLTSVHKPAVGTSLLTGAVLVSFLIVYASKRWWWSIAMCGANAMLWFVLAIQVMT